MDGAIVSSTGGIVRVASLLTELIAGAIVAMIIRTVIVPSTLTAFVFWSPGLVSKFGLSAFAAGGVFPAALLARLLRDDGKAAAFGSLLQILFAEFRIFFTFLAGAEALTFGDSRAA